MGTLKKKNSCGSNFKVLATGSSQKQHALVRKTHIKITTIFISSSNSFKKKHISEIDEKEMK